MTSFKSKEREAPVGLGRGEGWRRGGCMASLLCKPIKEEEPGARHPINLTSLAAKISEDIRREFSMWRLGGKVTNSWKTAPVYLKNRSGATTPIDSFPAVPDLGDRAGAVRLQRHPDVKQAWPLCHKQTARGCREAPGHHTRLPRAALGVEPRRDPGRDSRIGTGPGHPARRWRSPHPIPVLLL